MLRTNPSVLDNIYYSSHTRTLAQRSPHIHGYYCWYTCRASRTLVISLSSPTHPPTHSLYRDLPIPVIPTILDTTQAHRYYCTFTRAPYRTCGPRRGAACHASRSAMGWMPSSSAISWIPPSCSAASCILKQNLKAACRIFVSSANTRHFQHGFQAFKWQHPTEAVHGVGHVQHQAPGNTTHSVPVHTSALSTEHGVRTPSATHRNSVRHF